ncbi:MAG: WG repeat-containing protein [Alistipes sp.]|nr:WG repeat-containing protein [Alistipes sp.]
MNTSISIHPLIESLSNPYGRFKTLQGIEAITDPLTGAPSSFYTSEMICFPVRWQGKEYTLKYLYGSDDNLLHIRYVDQYLSSLDTPYIGEFHYLPQEMLVFDHDDTPQYVDLILMERAAAWIYFNEYIDQCLHHQDRVRLSQLYEDFSQMALWLLSTPFAHRNLHASTLLVHPEDGSLHLIDLEQIAAPAFHPELDAQGEELLLNSDNLVCSLYTLGLKVLQEEPATCRFLQGSSMFKLPILYTPLISLFRDIAQRSQCRPMIELVEMLSDLPHIEWDRIRLLQLLEALKTDRTPLELYGSYAETLQQAHNHPQKETTQDAQWLLRRQKLLHRYTSVAPSLSDGLSEVEFHDRWGYVDEKGVELIGCQYLWVDRFCEGRAVVQTEEGFGLINKHGEEILPWKYELLEWDCRQGIAMASFEGLSGLFGRNGEELVPLRYTWIGCIDSDPFAARDEQDRYGYIRRDGTIAIPFQFEDATSFNFGKAMVKLHEQWFPIDLTGRPILDEVEIKFSQPANPQVP